MTKLEDVVKFQVILENTHTWAMRVFKPLMSLYIDQWKHVHCNVGIDAANSALSRRQQTIERWQTVMPMVQDLLDYHSSIDVGDDNQTKLTPTLLGLLVQQVVSSERQVLTQEVDRLIAERLKPLSLSLEKTVIERTTIETQETIRRASAGSDQSTLPSPGLTYNDEDPNDDEYKEPTGTFRTGGLAGELEDAENEFGRSTRSNPQISSSTQLQGTSTYEAPLAEEVPDAANAEDCETATPSGSTTQEEPGLTTRNAYEDKISEPFGSPKIEFSAHRPGKPSLVFNAGASTGSTESKPLPFLPDASKILGSPRRSLSPQPPRVDWKSPVGHVDLSYQSTRVTSQAARLSSSGPSNEPQSSAKDGGSIGEKPLIDLTNDSQES